MQLLKFELYKIFKQKSIWITLIILLGMSYLILNYPYDPNIEKELYKKWEGPITEEKVKLAESEYEVLQSKGTQHSVDSGDNYTDTIFIESQILKKIMMVDTIKNNVTQRLNELEGENSVKANVEKNMLEKINLNYFSYFTGPSQIVIFVADGGFMVLGVMLLLGLSPIYSNEYSSNVDNYIFSSKKGRKSLAWAKMGASLIYTLIVVFVWEMFSLLMNFLQHGNDGWSTPLQLLTAPYYRDSPYSFTALEYHFVQLGIHLLAAFAFALLIVLISSISKNSLISFFVSLSIFAVPIIIDGVQWLETILAFSYTEVLRVQFLFNEFKTVDVFGYPISYPVFACLIMIMLLLISIKTVLQIIKHKEITS
ncbi:hypothetical protein IMZ08_14035 [Bacillus luteolus]|uniref:ABC transporter permease n=1 Tax=Litchfieldia luteola TaxID=682179 RepID=A0ABR9QL23_9BACI|nr:hypothetical protein [Cytobacillus luteolus]MBE4909182.1 hypothetical protein [Cytobacillus luteolus]MBP1940365.1 ABC-type transport system involved in multi-copper enzyme maturation permease subunit [Cytobacillus luteolus]